MDKRFPFSSYHFGSAGVALLVIGWLMHMDNRRDLLKQVEADNDTGLSDLQ